MTAPVAESTPAAPPAAKETKSRQYFWLWVMCLLGVDYFSTLAYQPSISYQAAGRLAPVATVLVVLATLFGALPVYFYVSARSAHGQGSITLLERLVHGWRGKTLILILLGFAATDFVMIKTLSLADAAEHVNHNPVLKERNILHETALQLQDLAREFLGEKVTTIFDAQVVTTIIIGILSFVFWFILRKGFNRNILLLAVPIVALYLAMTGVILGHAIGYLVNRPELLQTWWQQVQAGDWRPGQRPTWQQPSWGILFLMCVVYFPKLALGLSGFELSLIIMPQVRGKKTDAPDKPLGRIRNTRKILIVAALIMSVYLPASVLVTSLLIPDPALRAGAHLADNRALSYLAHGSPLATGPDASLGPLFGPVFGCIYDAVTVVLLSLAGTSVMTALGNLLPQYLLRFGMELKWASKWGLLLVAFAVVNLLVTIYFRAEVADQRGAYATAVLVLMTEAAAVSVLSKRLKPGHFFGLFRFPWWNALIALLFALTTTAVIVQAPSGFFIACAFIVTILFSSVVARAFRSDEYRTTGFDFVDDQSKFLWDSLRVMDFPVLLPHRPGRHERQEKEKCIRRDHQLDPKVPIVFLEICVSDASNFYQSPCIEVLFEDPCYVIKVTKCASVAHTIADIAVAMSQESRPPGIHFGWSEMGLLAASWSYLAFGEGNVPWKVRELLVALVKDEAKRPRVVVG